MFKVFIGDTEVYSSPQVEPALSFALELHRVSNVEHVVIVRRVSSLSGIQDVDIISLQSTKLAKK